jgi:serine/threonine protein kinase
MVVHVSIFNGATRSTLMSDAIVNIIKVLGEGGFSFVYLAKDEHSGVSPSLHGS